MFLVSHSRLSWPKYQYGNYITFTDYITSPPYQIISPPTKFPWLYLLATPPDVAPTNNNVVKVMKTVLEDIEEKQKQNVSIKDPKEKLVRFDFVNHIEQF